MRRYWAIGALLLGSLLMATACNYRCAPQEHCKEVAPIFDYRSSDCVSPDICCAVMRQNIFYPPPNSYSIRPHPPASYGQTVIPETIQPNGPHDRYSGQNGVKVTYGGANPPPSTSGGGRAPNDVNGGSSTGVPGHFIPGGRDPTTPVVNSHPSISGVGPQNRRDPTTPVGAPGQYNPGGRDPTISDVGVVKGVEQDQQCGMSNADGLQQIKGFSEDYAKPGQYPWAVALIHEKKYLAGGSLIRPGVVLTAAHRLMEKNAADIVVRAGDWDLGRSYEDFKVEQREVERMKIHEGFNFSSGANNLALLFLKSDFQMSDNIRTICLPDPRKSFEGRRCIVAGWGKIHFPDKSFSTILKKVELPMVDKRTCQNQLRQTKLGSNYQLPESLICAGGELNRDACYGDGGSALFCSVKELRIIGGKDSGVFEQAGIVNWGLECGQQDVPGTYTDVAMFRYWIEEHLLPFRYRMGDKPLH
ncbi:phenoloxidase-activating factor 2 [Drosophila subpulchrella]|uniref:phenoloxidase-activating factor 2 n=1 Tax=Drosophila subpulchrella TaxID=1486046 RepID=UPI0018A15ED5|nr:phenoloxidase-activating factor 2 [Drosophila subpulchrella]